MADDLLMSIDRLKQGMADPEGQTIRAYRAWYDHPLAQQTGLTGILSNFLAEPPQKYPQEGVEAVPFMSVGDPLSMLFANTALKNILGMKGLKSSFKSADDLIEYVQYVQKNRDAMEAARQKMKDIPDDLWKDVADFLKKGKKK